MLHDSNLWYVVRTKIVRLLNFQCPKIIDLTSRCCYSAFSFHFITVSVGMSRMINRNFHYGVMQTVGNSHETAEGLSKI